MPQRRQQMLPGQETQQQRMATRMQQQVAKVQQQQTKAPRQQQQLRQTSEGAGTATTTAAFLGSRAVLCERLGGGGRMTDGLDCMD